MSKISCLYLSQEDLIKAGVLNMKDTINVVEESLKMFAENKIIFPEKVVMIFDEKTQSRINTLPAAIPEKNVAGLKWVSVFPENPVKYTLPNLNAVIVLSDMEKGLPLTLMDGTLVSNIRVGAVGAVAAKYLARKDSKKIGFIGSGEQAKTHLLGMVSVCPEINEVRIAAKTKEEQETFIKTMQPWFKKINFINTNSLEDAISGADIIVTATSAQAPLLKNKWVGKGTFYSHIGGWEDEFEVALNSDKIVVDHWETVKHRTQTLSRMYKQNLLTDNNIYADLDELASGKKKGREINEERIYFNAVGLSFIDISIAYSFYEKAIKQNLGQEVVLQETTIFEHQNLNKYLYLD